MLEAAHDIAVSTLDALNIRYIRYRLYLTAARNRKAATSRGQLSDSYTRHHPVFERLLVETRLIAIKQRRSSHSTFMILLPSMSSVFADRSKLALGTRATKVMIFVTIQFSAINLQKSGPSNQISPSESCFSLASPPNVSHCWIHHQFLIEVYVGVMISDLEYGDPISIPFTYST